MLDQETKESIQQAYRDFLSHKGIRARYGQRLMIAEIARYLGEITEGDGQRTSAPASCVVEAATGTGKTLAYLLAAIPVAQALGRKLVIATATVALQDQIVRQDLPDVREGTGLDFNWTLAKGRGRYLCLARLEARLQDEGGDSESLPLFLQDPMVGGLQASEKEVYERMLAAYAQRQWDGDRDHWPETLDDTLWRRITTDHRQCTNRHCSYFDSCAFFAARGELEAADVIVANHDLVLADLALGGGAILPPPEQTIYILDEAHHLPAKALNHFAATLNLQASRQGLKSLSQALAKLLPSLAPAGPSSRAVERITSTSRDLDQSLDQLYARLVSETPWEEVGGTVRRYRYPDGQVPEGLKPDLTTLRSQTAALVRDLGSLTDTLQKALGERGDEDCDRQTAEAWYPALAAFHGRAEEQLALWRAFLPEESQSEGPPPARWLIWRQEGDNEDLTLSSSPVLANEVLYTRLWNRAFATVLTSATLTALGRFDRLRMRTGVPEDSRFLVVPSSFDYPRMASLHVPEMPVEPGNSEAFAEALQKRLPALWKDDRAVLVLFTARRQMHQVAEALAPEWRDQIMTQDDHSRSEVLERHRARVDAGERSILFGVASFMEGIDLPGEYLEHVIITRLPFSVPDDPIEASLAEWISARGGNPFLEISVPDASIRLVQAAGRLLRKETDTGRITILDRRILTRRYGRLLLDSLPPFERVLSGPSAGS